ncbi:SusC/RagA family TonB-linked outer membrane protein [Parapedobacter sp.]
MKTFKIVLLPFLFIMGQLTCHAQSQLLGQVVTENGKPLANVTIIALVSHNVTMSDNQGNFSINITQLPDTITFTRLGYEPLRRTVHKVSDDILEFRMVTAAEALPEVEVNTGYYSLPKERATGSFVQIDNELLNRSVSTNILERLEGITPGLLFDRSNVTGEDVDSQPNLRIRGLSTIEANSAPLIVVDNFPYDGDIETINPNDVQSITILKDAAAASIWGARAGNGVIVINTKGGDYNQPASISFNSNITVGDKPDLFYNRQYLPPATVMEIQEKMFEMDMYTEHDRVKIPYYVEQLIKRRDGQINEQEFELEKARLESNDLRAEWSDRLYRQSLKQQYALGIRGGAENYRYAFSAGTDRNESSIVRNGDNRMNLSLQNTFRLNKNLEVTGTAWYTKQQAMKNGMGYSYTGGMYIYEGLEDEEGNPLPTNTQGYRYTYHEQAVSNGLLDWMVRPLDEVRLADNLFESWEWRLNGGVRYRFLDHFNLNATYQYTMGESEEENYYDKDTYHVRNLVNRFTQPDGTKIIPYGGILEYVTPTETNSHSFRAQLNYNQSFGQKHLITALGGGEAREYISVLKSGQTLYNFDRDIFTADLLQDYLTRHSVRPSGRSSVPTMFTTPNKFTNRNLSFFGNASYSYANKYVISGSLRWDGSNLVGVKTNQRGTALWSIGGSWELNKENFYRLKWLPYLRARITYGSAGNIDKSQTHYPVIRMSTNRVTNRTEAIVTSPGNPSLQWEQVNTTNLAVDWRMLDGRISGSFEYYDKRSNNLLGNNSIDPTIGISINSSLKMNYAALKTIGWDLSIYGRNQIGPLDWETNVILSHSRNKVTHFNTPKIQFLNRYFSQRPVREQQSVDLVYAHPWHGLNPETGYPLIFEEGLATSDYKGYYAQLTPEDLVVAGVRVPPLFGSLRNIFSYKNFQLGILLTFKTGHVFRRTSISSGQEFSTNPVYHMDYFTRWQRPGDEKVIDVPAYDDTYGDYEREYLYTFSETLITKGDVVRLQDINLSYTFAIKHFPYFQRARLYFYARNMGIIWRANDNGIDPEYAHADYPAPKSYSFGIQLEF